MEYRQLGNSGIKVSPITFGAWAIGGWMWGGSDQKLAIDAMHKALDIGITTFDTAPVYGMGHSESLVGMALKGKREKVQILTKYGLKWDEKQGEFYFSSQDNSGKPVDIYKYSGKESVIKECENSLKRLGTDYIDLYQIHWNDPTTPIAETMEAVDKLKRQGKIRAAGVCNYTAEQTKQADRIVEVESVQVPYSMVFRDVEKEVVPYCLDNNKGILAYSPLQRGILTGKIRQGHKFAPGDHRPATSFYTEPNFSSILDFLDKIEPIAKNRGVSLAQLVINWTIQQPGITAALVGARNPEQVLENAKAADFMLSEPELMEIGFLLNRLLID